MNNYVYFSNKDDAHSINSRRLNARLFRRKKDQLSNTLITLDTGAPTYITSDILLLDNGINEPNPSCDVSVYTSTTDIDDQFLRNFLLETFGYMHNEQGKIIALRLSSSTIGKLTVKEDSDHPWSVETFDNISVINDSANITTEAFTTKSRTLRFFCGLTSAHIDPGAIVRYEDWQADNESCIDYIQKKTYDLVIVRSSSSNEDGFECSNAGAFDSCPNINIDSRDEIYAAIERVFKSYDKVAAHDEVFIQRQITNPYASGVCTTRVLGKNSPYYVINYDDESGRTDSVTSGDTNTLKTLYVYKHADIKRIAANNEIKKLLIAIKAIEDTCNNDALDIEFVIDSSRRVNIVQVRPLVGNYNNDLDSDIQTRLADVLTTYREHSTDNDGINKGEQALFGVMPDANPAELIGINPKPLAFSLYQYLITDTIVTKQRQEYGYRDVRPVRHMIKIGGHPYVNVRSSFNSFTPAGVSEQTSKKAIDAYLTKLANNKSLHDKVEFDVVATTWFPGVDAWFKENYSSELSASEIEEFVSSLKGIFVKAVNNIDHHINEVENYQPFFESITKANLSNLQKASTLIDICYHYGCKPFAHLARSAFVAVSVLKGFVSSGILSKRVYDAYLHSIESISSTMEHDAYKVKVDTMSKHDFYEKYGHLRPGTYDICSEAYFEDHDKYLDHIISSATPHSKESALIDDNTITSINQAFSNNNIDLDFSSFDKFTRTAISAREFAKFKYTKFLSHGLHYLKKWGESFGFTRQDLAYLTIHDIHGILVGSSPHNKESISSVISKRKTLYTIESRIELPDIITCADDIYCFFKTADKPNYITSITTNSPAIVVTSPSETACHDLHHKIVMIDSADPGYDWLFGCKISGLITKYGGANSHMAIRCAELNIAAAIGVGDILFNRLKDCKNIELNCASGTIKEA